jgi:hypothetical protein
VTRNNAMKQTLAFALALLTAGFVHAAETNSTAKVQEALTKLKAATNYSWTTTIKMPTMSFEPGPVQGRTEKGGYSIVTQEFDGNKIEVVFKGEKVAVKGEDGWQLLESAEGGAAMMGGWLAASGTADEEAGKFLKSVSELKSGEGDVLSGNYTSAGATDLLTFRPRGGQTFPAPKDAKGSAKFWLKDGALAKVESNLQGKVSFGADQEQMDFEITRTIEIKNVDTTKVEVPADAKKKLENK